MKAATVIPGNETKYAFYERVCLFFFISALYVSKSSQSPFLSRSTLRSPLPSLKSPPRP